MLHKLAAAPFSLLSIMLHSLSHIALGSVRAPTGIVPNLREHLVSIDSVNSCRNNVSLFQS